MKVWKIVGFLGLVVFGVVAFAAYFLSGFRPQLVPIAVTEIDRAAAKTGLADCFWVAVVTPAGLSYLFPDTGASYWLTQFRLPEGATLELAGQYPHARHLSFSTYESDGRPVDRLNDLMIAPEAGSTNPFVIGARRDATNRAYRIQVAQADVKAGVQVDESERPRNTVFAKTGSEPIQLIMRVYVPDNGLDAKACVPLAKPSARFADGRMLEGEALCSELVIKEGSLRDVRLTPEATKKLLGLASTSSPYHPAQADASWHAFFNPPLLVATTLVGTSFQRVGSLLSAKRKGGFYSTLDNTYMSTFVDRRFGEVLVLRGKAPTTPKTREGTTVMQPGQLRYWSICKYRSFADTAAGDCVYDEQVPVDTNGNFVIALSNAAVKPVNATAACGVAWLDWGIGDGVGNPDGGVLVLRHMMPAGDFTHSLFATQRPGDEASVLGPYYPRATYMTKAEFEKRGCGKG